MKEVLLTSERFVKEVLNISDNVAGKYLLPAIREAQEIGLRQIIGDRLMNRLKDVVLNDLLKGDFDKSFDDSFDKTGKFNQYVNLLNKMQYYLAYQTAVELIYKVGYKVANAGVVTTSGDRVDNQPLQIMAQQKELYQDKADYFCKDLQRFLLRNRDKYPELCQEDCNTIKSNLHSSSTCGLWLGGARGRR